MLAIAAARMAMARGAPASAGTRLAALAPASGTPRWLDAELAATRADQAAQEGRWRDAAAAAREALALGHAGADALRGLLVDAALALGTRASALDALAEMQLEYPASPVTRAVEARVMAAGLEAAPSRLGIAALAKRWSRLTARAAADRVVEECRADLAKVRKSGGRALLECGRAFAAQRRREALELLRGASKTPALREEALLQLARAVSREGSPDDIAAVCRDMRASPVADTRLECDFLAAMMRLPKARARAREDLAAIAARAPKHPRGIDARWFVAFDTYRETPADGRTLLEALAREAPERTSRAQAAYWLGVARGDEPGAKEAFADAVRLDPWGYYGWLARVRLGSAGNGTTDACAAPTPGSGQIPPSAKLASLLVEAGFRRHARLELEERLSPKSAGALAWVEFLSGVGQFERVLDIGLASGGDGVGWPVDDAARAKAQAARPIAFPEALSLAPKELDRCLVLSVIRRESRYDPDAASGARARGLMQLLPETAEKIAPYADLAAPAPEHLYDPRTNVRLGSEYLKRLIERFGSPLLAVAAYNAGPNAVARWANEHAGRPLDEWVELIPYRETRHYVKAVGGAFAGYRLLYGGAAPPLTIGIVRAAGAGVDF